jgi:hypothetical protein
MQRVIDQSNVTWRRAINTANTAADNATNQANVQNLFNISTQALNNIWQQWRDEASWANSNSENALNRAHAVAIAALGRDATFALQNDAQKQALYESLGALGVNIVSSVYNNWAQ